MRDRRKVVSSRASAQPEFQIYFLVFALSLACSMAAVIFWREPIAGGGDEFANLLGAQTFAAGRMTNPTHPHWEFFETFHVLMKPSYMSKYPPAQSLVLALGYKLGHPIIGVWLSSAAFALATTWLIRSRLSRRWALLGGAVTVLHFGGTHYFALSYWGGAVAATAGALILGATLRLMRTASALASVLLGLGVAIGLLSRPFETGLLCIVSGVALLVRVLRHGEDRASIARHLLVLATPLVVLAILFQLRLNHAVTGEWSRLPYLEYEAQYSGSPLFVWQSPGQHPEFRNQHLAEFYHAFVVPFSRFNNAVPLVWFQRIAALFLKSLGPVLAVMALIGGITTWNRASRLLWATLAVSSIGFVLSYWWYPHYHAGLNCLLILFVIYALRRLHLSLRKLRPSFALIAVAMLAYCTAEQVTGAIQRAEIYPAAEVRQEFADRIISTGGSHLVFVRRIWPYNIHFIGVHNDADIDRSPIIWAHDRGEDENQRLIDYYGGQRRIWMMTESISGCNLQPVGVAP